MNWIIGGAAACVVGGLAYALRDPAATRAAQLPQRPSRSKRFGAGAPTCRNTALQDVGAGWYMNWRSRPSRGCDAAFVPMLFAYQRGRTVSAKTLDRMRRQIHVHRDWYPPGTLFVLGNEVGYRAQHDTRTPEQYADDLHKIIPMLRAIDSSFRISTGATILSMDPRITKDYVGASNGLAYCASVIEHFEQRYQTPLPVDAFAATAHVLEGDGVDEAKFDEQVIAFRRMLAERGYRDRDVVLTEVGVAIGTRDPQRIAAFARHAVSFVEAARDPSIGSLTDDGRLVQQMAWFVVRPLPLGMRPLILGPAALFIRIGQTSLFNRAGKMTIIGAAYADAVAATVIETM